MPDYKELYLKLFRAAGEAASTLIAAQRACEELYISSPEPEREPIRIRNNEEAGDGH